MSDHFVGILSILFISFVELVEIHHSFNQFVLINLEEKKGKKIFLVHFLWYGIRLN